MNDKQGILIALREEFNRWKELLDSLSEEQITAPQSSCQLVHQKGKWPEQIETGKRFAHSATAIARLFVSQ